MLDTLCVHAGVVLKHPSPHFPETLRRVALRPGVSSCSVSCMHS